MKTRVSWFAVFVCLLCPSLYGRDGGRIEGRIVHREGWGIGGVTIEVVGLTGTEISDAQGRFAIDGLPAGTYTVSFILGDSTATESQVLVEAGASTRIDPVLDWDLAFSETMTVTAASRRAERIVEAPAAVTTLSAEDVERTSSHGQLPRLLGGSPGVELTQSGLFDFTLNTRGFNPGVVNARLLVLIDGRDPILPSVGGQSWAAFPFALDELDRVELVRGPGAALYGAGAFNGVLNLITKEPRLNRGGRVRLIGGELDTQRLEGRYAGELDNGWYYKVGGGYQKSGNFTRSRFSAVEYRPDLLSREPVPLPGDQTEVGFGNLRFDRASASRTLSFEVGTASFQDTTLGTPGGRTHHTRADQPWARMNFNSQHWNLLGSYTVRDAEELLLSAGSLIYFDDRSLNLELQGNTDFAQHKGRLVGGASYGEKQGDSSDRDGMHTLLFDKQRADLQAAFAQLDYRFGDKLRGVFSGRWDDSDLHDSRFSPRAALVYAPTRNHTLRLTYGDAFRTPTFAELFFALPVAAPLDLSDLEQSLSPLLDGVALGFEHIPFLLVGNTDIEVEEITSFEVGYKGIIGGKSFLTASYYKNALDNFTTNALPQLGTGLGKLNPNFGPYAPPDQLSPEAAEALLRALASNLPAPLFALLSNAPDGAPIFPALSFTTFGRVNTEGIELDLHHAFTRQWLFDVNYTFFDFEVQEELRENPLIPSTPEHRFALSLSYVGESFDALVKYRWVDDFLWSSGIFVGPVPSYGVVEVGINYKLSDHLAVGADIANALDKEHYETFGGDLLRRRALAHLTFSW